VGLEGGHPAQLSGIGRRAPGVGISGDGEEGLHQPRYAAAYAGHPAKMAACLKISAAMQCRRD